MLAEFHLAAPVSGSWYCACWLTVTPSWFTRLNRTEPLLMLLIKPFSSVNKDY